MMLHRCIWSWSPRLKVFKHFIRTFRGEPWKEVVIASDEILYWQGRPHKVYLRWSILLFLAIGLSLIWVACFELTFAIQIRTMAIIVAGFGIVCLICSFINLLNLRNTTYFLTDRRVIVSNNLFHIRYEYDLLSYLKNYKGEFASYCVWQPSNRWDLCLIRSALYDGHANVMFVFFHSVLKEDVAIIKRVEHEIRGKHNAPLVDPRYRTCHAFCRWFR